MIYADYAYYTDTYGGKAVSQEDFLRLAAEASAYLDRVTLGRAEEHSEDDRLKISDGWLAPIFVSKTVEGTRYTMNGNTRRTTHLAAMMSRLSFTTTLWNYQATEEEKT